MAHLIYRFLYLSQLSLLIPPFIARSTSSRPSLGWLSRLAHLYSPARPVSSLLSRSSRWLISFTVFSTYLTCLYSSTHLPVSTHKLVSRQLISSASLARLDHLVQLRLFSNHLTRLACLSDLVRLAHLAHLVHQARLPHLICSSRRLVGLTVSLVPSDMLIPSRMLISLAHLIHLIHLTYLIRLAHQLRLFSTHLTRLALSPLLQSVHQRGTYVHQCCLSCPPQHSYHFT